MPDTSRQGPIAHLLLAAGASTRMGRPKQLLDWAGKSLIRHALNNIITAEVAEKVVVVLGAHQEKIRKEVEGLEIDLIVNADWEQGMSSTIRCGLLHLLQPPATAWAGLMISLVDQPLVQSSHYRQLSEQWRSTNRPVVAARYDQVLGVPALFAGSFFPQLLSLEGGAGARKLLMAHKADVLPIDLPEARFDLDTPEDYRKLQP